MRSNTWFAGAVVAFVMSRGDAAAAQAVGCGPVLTRAAVVRCALVASPGVRAEAHGVAAVRGREEAARALLPSNPVVAGTLGRPVGGLGTATAWSASLAQELEVGGQRGARLESARAEGRAQLGRAAIARRDAIHGALLAYFEAVAAREERALAQKLVSAADAMDAAAGARAALGLATEVDADLAYAGALRLRQAALARDRRAFAALATLASSVGLDAAAPGLAVDGELTPLAVAGAARTALAPRPELEVARAEAAAHAARATALRRARVPNPTLSLFVQTDTLSERTLGAGISFPLPLPSPLGRTHAGEIAEATALAARAEVDAARLQREGRLDAVIAAQAFTSRHQEVAAFEPARLARVERAIASIGEELAAGRLTARDALLGEQALIELLSAHIQARHALCVASVELARATGQLEGGAL